MDNSEVMKDPNAQRHRAAKDYCTNTVFVDHSEADESLIHNLRFSAFCAGWDAAMKLYGEGDYSNEDVGL